MCLAVPAQIKSINTENTSATADILGITQTIALDLLPQARIGDYVLVHAGYAIELIDEQVAHETIDLFEEVPELCGKNLSAAEK